ncbi:hypothetical protein PIB30_039850 [Stylosanthes scabra]|uniref:Uncharacterized protein n=1 Tax=Stylosanthes scabra TaxID=79078 RepID=A0ABU6UD28_9FABA|nr:hypothetical protein [Stylosanthes scabra]
MGARSEQLLEPLVVFVQSFPVELCNSGDFLSDSIRLGRWKVLMRRFIGVEKSMRKAKKNIGSKNGLEKACKSGDFTKKEECEAEKWSYSHRIGAKLGLFRKMNSMSTTFMMKTSSGSKRFYDEFASEDQCAENLLNLSILTFYH